jgi:hypothetical protein
MTSRTKSKKPKVVRRKIVYRDKIEYRDRVVEKPVIILKRSEVDEDFDKKITMWCSIALFFIFAWLFTFLPLTHQLGENNRLHQQITVMQDNFIKDMENCNRQTTIANSKLQDCELRNPLCPNCDLICFNKNYSINISVEKVK